jgi:hypothetical protein
MDAITQALALDVVAVILLLAAGVVAGVIMIWGWDAANRFKKRRERH